MKAIPILCAALAVSFCLRAEDKPQDPKSGGVSAFQGIWKPVEATMGGISLPPPALNQITLKIDGDKYVVTITGEGKSDKGTVTCDTSVTPNRMNVSSVEGPNKGKTFPAIYELKDADTLHVCYDLSGAKHPAEFKSTKDSQLFDITYKRQPAAEDPQDAIAALQKLGADVRRDGSGTVESVGLHRAKLTGADLAHFKALTTLKTLSLRYTELSGTGLEHLKGLKNLTSLYLPGSDFNDAGMEQIGKMSPLVNLYLQGTKITDAGMAHLKGLTNLRILYLDGTKITDAGLAHLKGLTLVGLYLSDTAVTDAGIEHLKGMTKLAYLDFTKTQVTEAGVKKMQQVVPNCSIKH